MGMNNRLLRPRQSGFNPRSISGLALWLDAADSQTLYTTDAGPVTAVSAPTEISGCVGWYDASDAATLFAADTGSTLATTTVGRWANKGTLGSAGDLLQATSAARPSMTAATQNGKPVLTFDGSNDFLRSASFTLNQPYTYIVVWRFEVAPPATVRLLDAGGGGVRSGEVLVVGGLTSLQIWAGAQVASPSVGAELTTFNAWTFGFNGASSFLRLPKSSTFNAGSAGSNSGSRLTLAANGNTTVSEFSNISVAELIVFNADLSVADRGRVEKYLSDKWNLAVPHGTQATATNDPVGAWLDKSGNGRHATQATGVSRPSVGSVNSRTALSFDGSNDFLLTATQSSPQPTACFAVWRNTNPLAYLFDTTSGNNRQLVAYGAAGSGKLALFGGADTMETAGAGTVGIRNVTTAVLNGASSLLRFNGALMATGNGGTNGLAPLTIGSRFNQSTSPNAFLSGNLCEMLAYTSAPSSNAIQQVERYLAAKWGITLAPQVSNADAQDWINRVYANGGTVSAATANAVNQFCLDIENAGIRDRFYRLNLFCGASDANLNAVRTPLYRGPSLGGTQYGNAIDTNVNFVQGDYAETGISGGLMGNGTNKSLQTGIRPDQMPTGFESNVHIAVYRRTTGNGQALLGSYYYNTSTTTDRHNYELALDGGVLGREVGAQVPSGSPHPRFTLATRSSSSSMFTYSNGTAGAENTGAVAGVATGVPFTVFGRNLITGNPPASGTYSATFNTSSILCGYSIGASLTPAQVTAYTAAMQAFQTALSRNV